MPDAQVLEVDTLPDQLEGAEQVGQYMQIRPGAMLLRVPEVGAFLAEDGTTVRVAPVAGADPGAVDMYLHGAARAAILHQRGDLPLHASCLLPPDGLACIAVCGFSGAGKSTLAAEMHRRGWMVLADDSTRVSPRDGKPFAWPSHRGIKLWQDACERLELPTEKLQTVRTGLQKFFYPVTQDTEPLRLGTVVELTLSGPGLVELPSIPERMALLTRHTFRQRQVAPLGMLKQHLQLVGTIAGQITAGILGGGRRSTVEELGNALEEVAQWKPLSS